MSSPIKTQNPPLLLSTRALRKGERQALEDLGFDVLVQPSVAVKHLAFDMPQGWNQAVFTSQHAVASFVKHPQAEKQIALGRVAHCVGALTQEAAVKAGFRPGHRADKASDLATLLIEQPQMGSLYFFCGDKRLAVLPARLAEAQVDCPERVVYRSRPKSTSLNRSVDYLLFYSPSAVQSFTAVNTIGAAKCVCIGPTTAAALTGKTQKVWIAQTPDFNALSAALQEALRAE